MTAYEKVGAMVCVFVHCLIWEEFKLMRLETNESLFVQVLKRLFVYLCTECSSINLFYLRAMSALCLSVCVCVVCHYCCSTVCCSKCKGKHTWMRWKMKWKRRTCMFVPLSFIYMWNVDNINYRILYNSL